MTTATETKIHLFLPHSMQRLKLQLTLDTQQSDLDRLLNYITMVAQGHTLCIEQLHRFHKDLAAGNLRARDALESEPAPLIIEGEIVAEMNQ